MKRYTSSQALIVVLVGAVLLWVCLYRFVLPSLIGGQRAKVPMTRMAEEQFLRAMEKFREMYGSYPAGDEIGILKALAGNNAGRVRLLNLSIHNTNKLGQYIDPWRIPYRVAVGATNVTIQSAGNDKVFGDTDDIIMNSSNALQ